MIYSLWEGLMGRGKMPRRGDDHHVLDFRPESGFSIEKLAEMIVQAMRELDMDAQISLPGSVVLEIERECSEQEIVDGYNTYMSTRIGTQSASNKNEKEPR